MGSTSSENFCLRWNDFESNVSGSFRELRAESDFFDVTLGCDQSNGRVLQAHKVILSACSSFFKRMLKEQIIASGLSANPYVYLRGVKFSDLSSILDFMYQGEVNVAQSELNSFLAVAEDLQVKGLTQPGGPNKRTAPGKSTGGNAKRSRSNFRSEDRPASNIKASATKREKTDEPSDDEGGAADDPPSDVGEEETKHQTDAFGTEPFDSYFVTTEESADPDPASTTTQVSESSSQPPVTSEASSNTPEKVTDFNELVFGLLSFENGIHTCNLCGKKSPWRTTMLRHVEANHVETAGHVCDICGNVSKTRHAFNMHKKRMHEKGPDGLPTNSGRRTRKAKQAKAHETARAPRSTQQIQIVQEQDGQQVVHQGQMIDGQVVIQTQMPNEVITQQFN
ncbi:hypothetical protein TCAL_16633 [Tigriopus californicus]|uniref:BTB domain-containing protein n=1 Tax=Tigriopus californicus TaxID=6832 RepID=A0A553NFW2_TIGCA|nr:protein bric-a-brac 2-like [Tigriopus californicus]TRY64330.1 hypothetical protein TCAL_16633 [Tigriopus californicus]